MVKAVVDADMKNRFAPQFIPTKTGLRYGNYKYVDEELIRRAHLKALPVWTWTVNDENNMRRLIEMGVDAIYTNWPERLLKILC